MLAAAKLSRRHFTRTLAAALALPRLANSQTTLYRPPLRRPRFSVFSLFQPQRLTFRSEAPLILHLNQTDAATEFHRIPSATLVQIRTLSGDRLEVALDNLTVEANAIRLTSTSGEDAAFTLAVPPPALHGTIHRQFQATVEVRSALNQLQTILTMDAEAATASIVHAESPSEAPLAYLQAQAIVSRSFLIAADTGHHGFDFCDTTHCQFLRESPPKGSPAFVATRATMNLHLTFEDRPFAAMYSRSCGGRTHTLADLGLHTANYPYYAVDCPFCLEHPEQWRREIDKAPRSERERLAFNRIHGWSTLPSNDFLQDGATQQGRGIGHGIGLCQLGAAALAARSYTADTILAHFYPNTTIRQLDG
ncbi:MAG TPA: SpoIID/LytB domain-containing protein [Edaphobacter sp.]